MLSPNHLDLDEALQELRNERPSAHQRARGVDQLMKGRRISMRVPGLAAAAVAIIAALFLIIPTRGNSLGWPEAIRNTQQAENLRIIMLSPKGQVIGEQLRSGANWSLWIKDETGRILCENRCDDLHFYWYLYRKEYTAPNATQCGTLSNRSPKSLKRDQSLGGPIQTIDDLAKSKNTSIVSQKEMESHNRTVKRYEMLLYGKEHQTFDVDPTSGRILFVYNPNGESERFEYPGTIDPKNFAFESRITKDAPVIDLRGKEDPKSLPPFMPGIVASKGGIQFRGASISSEGDLFIYWTGYLPDNKGKARPRVIGIRTGKTRWFGYWVDGVHPVQGPPSKRLVCYRVELPEKIGSRITIRIPTAKSYMEFRDVEVNRPHALRD